ncbi:MAG: hypothetical protein FJ404_05155 [Verrucomicrobia bacterium]|nr:hypothetical protein [Verrucomicrobiota bacterium]
MSMFIKLAPSGSTRPFSESPPLQRGRPALPAWSAWSLFLGLVFVSLARAGVPVATESALFTHSIRVTLDEPERGTTIRSTRDGSIPSDVHGTPYHSPFTLQDTTILRFAVFREGQRVSPVITRSYIRLDQVEHQTGSGSPSTWGVRNGQPVRSSYRLASEILADPEVRADFLDGLRRLPTVSLSFDPQDLFGADRGLYAHPMEYGEAWERPCSLEYFPANGSPPSRVEAGARIQGGWNRRPEESPKHAFRIFFKSKYGPAQWQYPLFGPQNPTTFNSLILRAGCNNTWLHWSGVERARGDYIRDQWMRDTAREMGLAASRGHFVHLYLNGLYWGLYNLTERPDHAYAASVWGGKKSDYESRNGENLLEGDDQAWKSLFAAANGPASPAALSEIERLLDVQAFADYMLLNYYGANGDWDRVSNWYAVRRKPSGKFLFLVWDGERTLEQVRDNTLSSDDDLSPTRLFHRLKTYPEFRDILGKRARHHLVNRGGALRPDRAAARYQYWADLLRQPIVAESARWGAYRRDIHPYKTGPYELYQRGTHWSPEILRLTREYFPQRTGVFLEQLREAGLIGDLGTPP